MWALLVSIPKLEHSFSIAFMSPRDGAPCLPTEGSILMCHLLLMLKMMSLLVPQTSMVVHSSTALPSSVLCAIYLILSWLHQPVQVHLLVWPILFTFRMLLSCLQAPYTCVGLWLWVGHPPNYFERCSTLISDRTIMHSHGASTSAGNDGPSVQKDSKRPKSSAFTQQELPACKPLLTPRWVITIFMLVGIVFIPIGVAALLASRSVVEIIDEYQTVCVPSTYTNNDQRVQFIQDVRQDKHCNRTLRVSKLMKSPVYVYYQLDNFYQNHRRYVKSRSDEQLLDGNSTDTSACKPEQYLGGLPIIPCGLIAWSLFNDTYNISTGGQQLTINKKGISWKSDREHKFGKVYPQNFPNNLPKDKNGSLIGGATLDPNITLNEEEDLIVWMRTAALPTFRKLYGKIEQDLTVGSTLSITIDNVYNTYSFGGKKKLVLSTTSWLGGKNDFLGVAYITVGSLCICLALVFFLVHWTNPRPLGDTKYLSWNRHASVN